MQLEKSTLEKYPSLGKLLDVPPENVVESHDGREITLLRYIYNHPNLDSELRGSPKAILAAMDEFAAKEDFLISIGPDKAATMVGLIQKHRPKVLVELGAYVGYSAILFGSAIRDINTEDAEERSIRVYSIELDPLIASIAMNFVSLAGLSDIVEVIVGPSDHTLRRLHSQKRLVSGGIDMLFVDHVEDLYKRDVELCENLGLLDKEGCLVVADNVVRPGAPMYREYVRSNSRFGHSWGVSGLIIPGDIEDELEISQVGHLDK